LAAAKYRATVRQTVWVNGKKSGALIDLGPIPVFDVQLLQETSGAIRWIV